MDIKTYLEQKRQDVDRFLESIMPAEKAPPATLHKAMRYSLFAGGKRVRPILAIAGCEAICGASPLILPLAFPCQGNKASLYSACERDV